MATIKTDFGSGGRNLVPGGAGGTPSLAAALRDVADDLTALSNPTAAGTDGVFEGLLVGDPTTSSSQASGTGNTVWNVDITAGTVMVDSVEKVHTAQGDFAIHTGSFLTGLVNGASCYAWIVEKNDTGTVSTVAVKGTPATTGTQVAPTDAQIQTAVGAGVGWIKLALCLINRTGDTTVTQSQQVKYRQLFSTGGGATIKTIKG